MKYSIFAAILAAFAIFFAPATTVSAQKPRPIYAVTKQVPTKNVGIKNLGFWCELKVTPDWRTASVGAIPQIVAESIVFSKDSVHIFCVSMWDTTQLVTFSFHKDSLVGTYSANKELIVVYRDLAGELNRAGEPTRSFISNLSLGTSGMAVIQGEYSFEEKGLEIRLSVEEKYALFDFKEVGTKRLEKK